MLKPSEVKKAFARMEDENYAFRAYLKRHADEEELDKQFLALHRELFAGYDCNACRNCCKEYEAAFEEAEIGPAAACLGLTETDFRQAYIEEVMGDLLLKGRPCTFLEPDGSCRLGDCQPASCRDYPFTDKPERLFSLLGIVESSGVCPVVFEILEKLKQQYRFKYRQRR